MAEATGGCRVLLVTASMGGGHVQTTRELGRRLHRRGHHVAIVDLNDCMPGPTGRWLAGFYPWMVGRAPWLYDAIFRVFFKARQQRGERVAIPTRAAIPALRRVVDDVRPDVVVSTYHIAALAVGRLRGRGELRVPAVTFITTFGVHDLWLHPATDGYLCISEPAAEVVRRRTRQPVVVCGPVVREHFLTSSADRAGARADLGLPHDVGVALLMAGAFGMGDVDRAFRSVARLPGWTPVVVCGRNDALRATLEATGDGLVLGWVDDVAGLMAAADVLIDNAGGSSAKEALALGVPVVTFRPIAGHGRDDALAMQHLGVTDVVDDEAALAAALETLRADPQARHDRTARGRALFAGSAADAVERFAGTATGPTST